MEFKTTSSKRSAAAFSFVEMMVATGLFSILSIALWTMASFAGRSFSASGNYVDMETKGRTALDYFSRDVRRSVGVASYTTNSLVFMDYDGSTNLSYTYDPNGRTFTRTKAGASKTILTECDSLSIALYQRTPVGGTYEQFPAANIVLAKVIQVNWKCSRTILGGKLNTESVQTAKVVMRSK